MIVFYMHTGIINFVLVCVTKLLKMRYRIAKWITIKPHTCLLTGEGLVWISEELQNIITCKYFEVAFYKNKQIYS
jgi:hypothetical protein